MNGRPLNRLSRYNRIIFKRCFVSCCRSPTGGADGHSPSADRPETETTKHIDQQGGPESGEEQENVSPRSDGTKVRQEVTGQQEVTLTSLTGSS